MLKFWTTKGKRYRLIHACCLGMAVLAGAGGIFGDRIQKNRKVVYHFAEDAKAGSYVMPKTAGKEMMETIEQSSFRIQINASPELVNGRCNLMIGNPKENIENVQISLTLDDTGAVFYHSETLMPGQRKAYVLMDAGLNPGDYPVTAVFHVLDPESGAAVGEIETGVVLTVSY